MANKISQDQLFEQPPSIKEVVGIGKIWYDDANSTHGDAEKVHIMIYEESGPSGNDGFTAACLEYSLFVWGENEEQAKERIKDHVGLHLQKLTETAEGRHRKFEQLGEVFMARYWAVYRQITELAGDPESEMHKEKESQIEKTESKLRAAHDEIREKDERITMLAVDKDQLERQYREHISQS